MHFSSENTPNFPGVHTLGDAQNQARHCERSEAIQCRRTEGWIASLRSQ
jgi:hypothetical protein